MAINATCFSKYLMSRFFFDLLDIYSCTQLLLLYHEFFVRHNIYLNTRYHVHYNMVFFSVNKFVYHILSHSSYVLTAIYCSDFVYLCTSWSTDQTQLMTFINCCYLSMFHGFYLAICFWNKHSCIEMFWPWTISICDVCTHNYFLLYLVSWL